MATPFSEVRFWG